MSKETSPHHNSKRKPGRPPTYIFSKPDTELSENERRLKDAVIKRRLRQNRSYHKKKRLKELAAVSKPTSAPQTRPDLHNLLLNPGNSLPPTTQPPFTAALSPSLFPDVSVPVSAQLPAQLPARLPTQIPPQHQSHFSPAIHAFQNEQPNRVEAHTVATNTSPPSVPRYASASEMGIHLLSAKQYTADSSEPPASLSPTVQNSLVKRPSQALQDLLQASPADQLLPSFPQKPPSPEKADDSSSDEERLIEEILDVSAKTSLTESSRMVRQAASKPFLGQDVVARMASLPQYLVEGLKHLSLFPESFSAEAAVSVMGMNHLSIVTLPANILRPLIESNLVRPLPSGRFAMNDITKTLINSESTADGRGAHNRFISYFVDKLRHLDANSLSADGEDRLKAMKVYDAERANMQAALRMCRDIGGLKLVMSFLTQAATVMRYSTSPHERTEIFGQALNDMEMAVDTQSLDVEAEARIRLALGEAYFDSLSFEKAKDHLQKVIGVMVGVTDGSTVSVSSSVLALLLLAELRISNHEFLDAKKWLFQAVRTLQGANMQKSTFAVCCFLSLASVCTSMNQTSEALHTVNAAIDVLAEMGFTDMPIYADALRTLGTVHFRTGDWKKAQDAFFAALNICQKWMSRSDWDSAPFQHCTHLDIFLVESIAQTYIAQNRHEEAGRLMQTAQQQRLERRLDSKSNQSSSNSLDSEKSARMYTRHLY